MSQKPMTDSNPVVIAYDQSVIPCGGNAASAAADSGNPVKIGGVYRSTQPTLTDGQRGDLQLDSRGSVRASIWNRDGIIGTDVENIGGSDVLSNSVNVLNTRSYNVLWSVPDNNWQRQLGSVAHGTVNRPYALPSSDWSYAAATGGIINTTAVTIKAAAGAGVRNYITNIAVINTHATVATEFSIRDGAGGTVLWMTNLMAAGVGGPTTIYFPTPLKSTANTLLEVVCATTGAAVFFNAQGFTAA